MAKLLYIKASPLDEYSFSSRAADAFIQAYKQAHSKDAIETLDLFSVDLPKFDGPAVKAKYAIMQGQPFSNEQSKIWKNIEKVIEKFKSADKYVISIPMWNFSIPWRLKQYIDILVQPGYTFTYSSEKGYEGLVTGKPMLAIYARGGRYPQGTEFYAYDLQTKYVELIFKFIGFENIRSLVIEPTLMGSRESAEKILQETIDKAKKLALNF